MAFSFAKVCEVLLKDLPKTNGYHNKYLYPANNHIFAYNYSVVLDSVIDFGEPEKQVKSTALMYHKMISHTLKHILHNYKRRTALRVQYRVWAVCDYHTGEGKYVNYYDYPITEDLIAVKKEIARLTKMNVDGFDEKLDMHLDSLNIGALCDLSLYTNKEFKEDFTVVNEFWMDSIGFIRESNEKEFAAIITEGNDEGVKRIK